MNNFHSSNPLRDGSWGHHKGYFQQTRASMMQRYLLDEDRTLFTSTTIDSIDPPTHAFLGDLFDAGNCFYDGTEVSHSVSYRLPSPSSSGLESSGVSSSQDDRRETPWSSPELSSVPRIWRPSGIPGAVFGDHSYAGQDDSLYTHTGVAMTDVQYHHSDVMAFEDDPVAGFASYGSQPQEGYFPMLHPLGEQVNDPHNVPRSLYRPQERESQQALPPPETETPVNHSQRPQPSRAVTSHNPSGRVLRRAQPGRRSSHHTGARPKRLSNLQAPPANGGAFPCPLQPYGCTSTFGSKNEWKRHVTTQHMRWGFWRCAWCTERKPKDFNRKDLFIEHIRRMHRQELGSRDATSRKSAKDTKDGQEVNAVSERCYLVVRSPPDDSQCLMCDVQFQGPGSWEHRMEHVGRHLEGAKKGLEASVSPQDWREDHSLHEWMAEEGIIVRSGKRWAVAENPSLGHVSDAI